MVAQGDSGKAPEVTSQSGRRASDIHGIPVEPMRSLVGLSSEDKPDIGAVYRWVKALRRCVRCGEPKPMGQFYARQDRPGRERPHCRACHVAMTMLWQRENRTRKNEANRRYRLRNRDADRERSSLNRAKRKDEREAGA